ncbi:hypothetical protein GOP47_0010762 [Adiantum capillus-veneris]|uniref:Uncharacterized protein n=1 Tax=Adiantum capillus-veneris TaxID=13818 RepID=A0A9D4ZJ15_ADICA|nr:hypothetical protein GOP47_0010762 [Adiantum capillus-veneris]
MHASESGDALMGEKTHNELLGETLIQSLFFLITARFHKNTSLVIYRAYVLWVNRCLAVRGRLADYQESAEIEGMHTTLITAMLPTNSLPLLLDGSRYT